MKTTEQIGTAIRMRRKQLKITQKELAMTCGTGLRFIVDLEAGKPTLRLEHVLRVVDSLGGEFTLNGFASSHPATAPTAANAHDARGDSASGLGRAHCAGPRTQDGIRVASHIYSMEDRGAVPRTAPYWV